MGDPVLSFGAGVLLRCDCGGSMMIGLTDAGDPQMLHAVPVCESFTAKALGQTEPWVRRLLEPTDAVELVVAAQEGS